jgi:hypothetical protein
MTQGHRSERRPAPAAGTPERTAPVRTAPERSASAPAAPGVPDEVLLRLQQSYARADHRRGVELVRAHQGRGAPLPPPLRRRMEEHLGHDLTAVRVHTDDFAARAAACLGANAFAVQNDIFFGRGMFAPERPEGLHRLAHELTHTLQQGGRPRAASAPLLAALEDEAERAARGGRSARPLTRVGPMLLREPTYPRRTTGDAMIREVERVLSLGRDPGAGNPAQRLWSRVGSTFALPSTAGTIARRVWTYVFLRHFTEPDSGPGVESAHPRYFYSRTYGWVDGQHFFGFIDFAEQQYRDSGGDRQAAFTAATAQGLAIETNQQRIRDYVVLNRPPATDVTRLMQVQPPNTPLFRGPQAVAAAMAQGAAEAYAFLSLGDTTQGELFSLLDAGQRRKFFVDSAKSAFTYEDFRSNQLGVRFFYEHGVRINSLHESIRESSFRDALGRFFVAIAVENDQAVVDRLASGLPRQEQFSAGTTTEALERQRHPELFQLPQ